MAVTGTSEESNTKRSVGPAARCEARAAVIDLLQRVAPDIDATTISGYTSLHDVAGLDSLDFLRLVSLIAEDTGVFVPPRDYPLIVTLDGLARYLAGHRSAGTGDVRP
jgi:acyl carrier protein